MTDLASDGELLQHELLALLRTALDRDGFVVHAEPIVDLVTGETCRHELTLCLPAGEKRLIPPAHYYPIAERFGLTAEIDDLLIRRAAGLAADDHAVAVDVREASLADPDLAGRTAQALADENAEPALVTFELSEDELTSTPAAATAFVRRMHDLGANVTGDHFGTGAAGFGYLKRLLLDCLKIDASFVAGLRTAPSDEQFVRAFVQLAQGLRSLTGADGILDEETRQVLQDAGVDEGQGPLFGAPAPVPDGGFDTLTSLHPAGDEH